MRRGGGVNLDGGGVDLDGGAVDLGGGVDLDGGGVDLEMRRCGENGMRPRWGRRALI